MHRRRAAVEWRHLVNWREAARCGEWAQHFFKCFLFIYVAHNRKSASFKSAGLVIEALLTDTWNERRASSAVS